VQAVTHKAKPCLPVAAIRKFDRSVRHLTDIRRSVLRIGQEVEYSAVVPHVVVMARKGDRSRIAARPIDRAGASTKTGLRDV
jgi:hypothetical protein